MNKIIAAMVGLLMIASPALATFPCYGCGPTPQPEVASSQFLLSASGMTTVATLSTIDGWDGAPRAGVAENICNDGSILLETSVDFYVPSFGASEMVESKFVSADGDTSIIKQAEWYSPGPVNTANLYIGWLTDSAADEVDVTNVGAGMALYNMNANSLVNYWESFALNAGTDCDPESPIPPVPPSCDCVQLPCFCI